MKYLDIFCRILVQRHLSQECERYFFTSPYNTDPCLKEKKRVLIIVDVNFVRDALSLTSLTFFFAFGSLDFQPLLCLFSLQLTL